MDNSVSITMPPQFVVNVVQVTGGNANFTVLAGVSAFAVNISTEDDRGGFVGEEFTLTEKTKLSFIEDLATAALTGGEIKVLYENEAQTNAFTDTEKSKLAGIDTGAKDDQTGAEIKTLYQNEANAFTDTQFTKLAGIATGADVSPTPLTNAQIKTQYELNGDTNVHTDAQVSKLAAIENSATVDQSDGEIETAYNAQVAKISAGEITAGTEVTVRRVSPADLKAIVLAHETGSGDPNPNQVTAQEIIDGTETALRSFSPDDIEAMAQLHGAGFPDNPVINGKLSWLTDVVLERDGAGILAQRDGANNQRQRWYAWYTDADNGEWGEYGWSGGVFYLGSFANGTGTGRAMGFVTDGVARWAISATGDFAASVDNTHDIGLSGSNRPKDMFLGGTLNLMNVTANKSSMVISGYSLTGANAQNMVDLSGTWNTTGAPTLIYADMLDTASDAGTMLVNLKVGGVSMFSVTKAGLVTAISGLGGMSDSEVKTAYENNSDTNAFNDAAVSKLGAIEASADVTDATNVDTAGAIMDDDISAGEGFLRKTGTGAYEAIKTNIGVATDPGASNDNTEGYAIGSRWFNTTADREWVCLDVTTDTAVWLDTTAGSMSDAAVRAAVEAATDSNVFTDADHTKLNTIVEPDIDYYDLGMDFLGKPTDAQVIARWIVLREITMPADFSGAGGNIITNPTGALVIDIKDDGTTIGTISIATDGVFTFTTVSGTEKVVVAGSIVTAIGPGTADATGEDIVFTLPGVL